MAQRNKIATVFGGTGFLGTQIIKELAALGYIVKVATRVPESAYFLKPCGAVGQIVPFACCFSDSRTVRNAVKNADIVINCIGILFEKGKKSNFKRAHIDIPAMIARACSDEKISRFVHISALGCDKGTSKYAKTKMDGEKVVLANYPLATILRPSVMFGSDDNFFNMFAELARYVPFLPLIGGGNTKFQPVYVGDVADATIEALTNPRKIYQSKIYQLGGSEIVSFSEVFDILDQYTQRKKKRIKIPFILAKCEAIFLSMLPKPLLTPDQVENLKTDNIVEKNALGFHNFNITPKSMDVILPSYLKRYRSGGMFADMHAA